MTHQTTIEKTHSNFNPFFIDGKEINQIIFFRDGKIVSKSRWFDSNNITPKIYFDFLIPKKLKLDLNTKQAFYMKDVSDNHYRSNKYNVYIHGDLVNFKNLGEIEAWDTDTHISYEEKYSFEVVCERYSKGYSTDETLTPKKWTIEFTTNYITRQIEKPFYKEVTDAETLLKAKGINLNSYDLQNIIKHFKLISK